MNEEHWLVPLKDHYTCMVDLCGRAGCFDEAKNLIEFMPMQPDAVIWRLLLAACKVRRYVAESGYSLLTELGRWSDVVKVKKLMRQ